MESKVEDLSLPNAVVQRIIKEAVPPGTIVAKDARLAISRVRLYIKVLDPSIFHKFIRNPQNLSGFKNFMRWLFFGISHPTMKKFCLDLFFIII